MTAQPQPQPAHTPEPWHKVLAPTQIVAGPVIVANINHKLAPGEANAARIVACVNAMAGVGDPEGAMVMVRESLAQAAEWMRSIGNANAFSRQCMLDRMGQADSPYTKALSALAALGGGK
jgi:hypothetical protein